MEQKIFINESFLHLTVTIAAIENLLHCVYKDLA